MLFTVLAAGSLLVACGDDDTNDNPDNGTTEDTNTGTDSSTDTGTTGCTDDSSCTQPANPCQVASCNTTSGACEVANAADGTACSTGNACVEDQQCQAGTCGGGSPTLPDCGTAQCGSDSCGNSCGECPDGEICTATGECSAGGPGGCGDITFEGCCGANGVVTWCDEEGVLQSFDCPTDGPTNNVGGVCGWLGTESYFWCIDEELPDTSGNFDYLCPGEACADACSNQACGFDCGQECGTCDAGQECSAEGACEDCADKCGGNCGECADGEFCNADRECVPNACGDLTIVGCCTGSTTYYCANNEIIEEDCGGDGCGWDPDNAWYYCGFTEEDPASEFLLDCSNYTFDVPNVAEPGPEPGPEPEPEAPADEAMDAGSTDTAMPMDTTPAPVTFDQVHGIFMANCGGCHTAGSSGGHSIGQTDVNAAYADSQLIADSALTPAPTAGETVGSYALVLIQAGEMPRPLGTCDGSPAADDSTNCLTQAEQDLIQAWLDDGQLGPQ